MSSSKTWASAVAVYHGDEIVLILEYGKGFPFHWKFPSGCNNKNDNSASDTAVRRVQEKTGLIVPKLTFLFSIDRKFHTFYMFSAHLDSLEGIKKNADEREIEIFHKSELDTMADLLPRHQRYWRRINKIKSTQDLSLV